jgi:ribosomal protein L37AE/L43A
MKPVDKYTRARRQVGREIACPLCSEWVTVYHFAWSAITCQKCKADVDKEKWLVVDDNEMMKRCLMNNDMPEGGIR